MKSLFECIEEYIFESKLGNSDLPKHQYNYIYQLLNYIISGKTKEEYDKLSKNEKSKLFGDNPKLPFTKIKINNTILNPEWFEKENVVHLKNKFDDENIKFKELNYKNKNIIFHNTTELSDDEYDQLIDSEEFLPDKFHYALFYCLTDNGLKALNNLFKTNISDNIEDNIKNISNEKEKYYYDYKLFNLTRNKVQKKGLKDYKRINLNSKINSIYTKFKSENNIDNIHKIDSFDLIDKLNEELNNELKPYTNERFGIYKVIWNKIDKSAFIPIRIYTADQENATCELFNYFKNSDEKINKTNIINILNNSSNPGFVNIASDNKWINSYLKQIPAILKFLKGNAKDYTMVRFNKDSIDKLEDGNIKTFAKNYTESVNSYAKNYDKIMQLPEKNGSNKDNYDPSDVLLIHKDIQNIKKYNFSGKEDKSIEAIEKFKKEICELYDNKMFYGISLKQITSSPKIELYNLLNESTVLTDIELDNSNGELYNDANDGKGKSIALYFTANIKGVKNIIIDDNPENDEDIIDISKGKKRYKLSLRTFGNYIGIDIALSEPNKKGAEVSLGKSSKSIWCDGIFNELNKYLGNNMSLFNKYKRDLTLSEHSSKLSYINKDLDPSDIKKIDYFKYLFKILAIEYNKGDKELFRGINPIERIANSALKFGTRCLPYMIIH